MRRLASAFITLWISVFVPSLIIWGLMVRWSESASHRFESIWRWSADRLAFPLIFSPITDWSWFMLDHGTALGAVIGFLILIAVWALMIALPLIFIGGSWTLIATRLAHGSAVTMGTSGYDAATTVAYIPATQLHAPSRALYLLTIPIALVGVSIKSLFGPKPNVIWELLKTFILTFVVVVLILALILGRTSYWARFDVLHVLYQTMWFGYLDTIFIPRIFEIQWIQAADTITFGANTTDFSDWPAYMGAWYRHEEFRVLVGLTAARHALAAVAVEIAIRLVRKLF